jgi:hypothetical protein
MTEIEIPPYLRRVYVPRMSASPLPPYFVCDDVRPRIHQTSNECWAIAALQMTQDRARIAGIYNRELEAMTPAQLERASIKALASHYDKLHGLEPGTVASRRQGGILAMALDYLEMAGHVQPESSVVLHSDNATDNLKHSLRDAGPVAITYDGDGAGEIHSACIVGWDDATGDWLLRNSWGPTTERIPQTTRLVAFAITPRGYGGSSGGMTPFSGSSRHHRRGLSEWYWDQSSWTQAAVGVGLVAGIVVLGLSVGLFIWWLDKKMSVKKIPNL